MQLTQLIDIDDSLASLPDIFYRLRDAIEDDDSTFDDIGEIIAIDPALTTRVLRIVNSAFYCFETNIDTIPHALSVIGTTELYQLALATSVMSQFKGIPRDLMDMESYWKHSVACGLIARSIAWMNQERSTERYFVAGLLHDIGRLVMCIKAPDLFTKAMDYSRKSGDRLQRSEAKVFGFDHGEVGGMLLETWNLPSTLQEAVAYHHRPSQAPNHVQEACVVNVANGIAHALELAGPMDSIGSPADPNSWITVGPSVELRMDEIRTKVTAEFDDIMNIFLQAA